MSSKDDPVRRVATYVVWGAVITLVILGLIYGAAAITGTARADGGKYRVQSDEAVAYAKGITLEQAVKQGSKDTSIDYLSPVTPAVGAAFLRLHSVHAYQGVPKKVRRHIVTTLASGRGKRMLPYDDGTLYNPAPNNVCSLTCGFGSDGSTTATIAAADNDGDPTSGYPWQYKWALGHDPNWGIDYWAGAGLAIDGGYVATIASGGERCRTVRNYRNRRNPISKLETMWMKLSKRWCWASGHFTHRYAIRVEHGRRTPGAIGQWKSGQVVSKGTWNSSTTSYSWATVKWIRNVCVPYFGCVDIQEHSISASITAYNDGSFRKGS
jgi:hypothetical protein